ncbi:hypothetical protein MHYP_G00100920 [Metynnis hypsauchen]
MHHSKIAVNAYARQEDWTADFTKAQQEEAKWKMTTLFSRKSSTRCRGRVRQYTVSSTARLRVKTSDVDRSTSPRSIRALVLRVRARAEAIQMSHSFFSW